MNAPVSQASTVLQFLIGLRPAIPFSREQGCQPMSNSELRRAIQNGSVLINTERVAVDEKIDFPVFSIVFFPKSSRKCTVW